MLIEQEDATGLKINWSGVSNESSICFRLEATAQTRRGVVPTAALSSSSVSWVLRHDPVSTGRNSLYEHVTSAIQQLRNYSRDKSSRRNSLQTDSPVATSHQFTGVSTQDKPISQGPVWAYLPRASLPKPNLPRANSPRANLLRAYSVRISRRSINSPRTNWPRPNSPSYDSPKSDSPVITHEALSASQRFGQHLRCYGIYTEKLIFTFSCTSSYRALC